MTALLAQAVNKCTSTAENYKGVVAEILRPEKCPLKHEMGDCAATIVTGKVLRCEALLVKSLKLQDKAEAKDAVRRQLAAASTYLDKIQETLLAGAQALL
jgi:hypothetical protein